MQELTDFNLERIEKETIKRCFELNPEKSISELALLLGVSSRTLSRKTIKHHIFSNKQIKFMNDRITYLEKRGYKITE